MQARNILIGIIAVVIVLYGPFVSYDYINFDDAGLIFNNPAVLNFDVVRMFTSYDPELYIPLTLLSYMVEHAVFDLAPWAIHTTNMLLHALSACLVFLIGKRLTRSTAMGLIAGLLFAVHPIQSTAVLWGSARKDLLSSALALLTLWLYMKESKWSIGTYALALLSKISVGVLPLLLLLIDHFEGKPIDKDAFKSKWPYFGLSFLFGCIAIVGKSGNLSTLAPFDYILLSAKSLVFSLQNILMPVGLTFMYPQMTEITVSTSEFFVPILLIVVAVIALILLRKRAGILAWCLLWFVICIAPNLLTYSQNGYTYFASNRYVYLACIGVFLYIAKLLVQFGSGSSTRKTVSWILTVVMLIGCSYSTVQLALPWSSSELLMRSAIAAGYESPVLHKNIGAALREEGKTDKALAEFLIAGETGSPHAYKIAGDLYAERGDTEKSMEMYRLGMEVAKKRGAVGTQDLAAHFKIGEILMKQNRHQEAFAVFQEAVEIGDTVASAHLNFGLRLLEAKKFTSAKKHLDRAVKLNRFSAPAHYHLALYYVRISDKQKALDALKRAVDIDPDYMDAKKRLEELRRQ